MAIGRSGTKYQAPKKARTMRGMCIYCHHNIIPGELYEEGVGGTNSIKQGLAHTKCYGPQTQNL